MTEKIDVPAKTVSQLLAEDIPYAGGLAMLAAEEQALDGPPQTAVLRASYQALVARQRP